MLVKPTGRNPAFRRPTHVRPRQAAIALTASVAALGVTSAMASGSGSVSLSPPLLTHVAAVGGIGSITVDNGTAQTMKTSVSVHPWLQGPTGLASPNQSVSVGDVRVSTSSFTLGPRSSKVISLALVKVPAQGSIYANVDVVAQPTKRSLLPGTVNFGYRLIGSLRLTPVHARYGARFAGVVVRGNHRSGTVALAITNTGNTLASTGGSVYLKSSRAGANASVSSITDVPGATVDATVYDLNGSLPAGNYSVSATLLMSGHHVANVHNGFTLH